MIPAELHRALTYSMLIHVFCLGWYATSGMFKETGKTYYAVDFVAGIPEGMKPKVSEKMAKKEARAKASVIDRKEDLLIKSKKPLKMKEVVEKEPPKPTLEVPKPPEDAAKIPQAVPGVPVDSVTGIGIGFGKTGWGRSGSGAGTFPYTWYVHSMKKKLDANWNVTGTYHKRLFVQVAFTILRDGQLTDIDVEETSRNDDFDRAALRAVTFSAPMPPLPKDFPESNLRVHVRFTVKN